MQFTQNDFDDTSKVARCIHKVDNMDAAYINKISDEIYECQPFFLTVYLGYRLDVSLLELDEILKIAFLIWEYFRDNDRVRTIKITESQYNKVMNKNMKMLADSKNTSVPTKLKTYELDIQNLRSKALLMAIFARFFERPTLKTLDQKTSGILQVGLKSFIEVFENI